MVQLAPHFDGFRLFGFLASSSGSFGQSTAVSARTKMIGNLYWAVPVPRRTRAADCSQTTACALPCQHPKRALWGLKVGGGAKDWRGHNYTAWCADGAVN